MQAFVVVLLASFVCLGAANPHFRPSVHFFQSDSHASFYKPAENTLTVAKPEAKPEAKPHVAAFASIFQNDEIVPLQEIPVEEVAMPLAVAIQPVLSDFHDEPSIFENEHSDEVPQLELPNSALPNEEVPSELAVETEDNENIIVVVVEEEEEDEDNEYIPSPSDIPGFSYADTPAKMSALGIDSRFVDPGILEDSFLLVPDLIRKYGYPCEVHSVQTSDGYILEMHRIPYSPRNRNLTKRTPVFVMHGLLDSSSSWVIMGPYNGLAYLLADLGYDVWLGNARGNRYSRTHITFNPDGGRSDRRRFWEFSWHQVGTIDLPRMIDHVIEQTGVERIHYIGHSQGTTSFFVMASERPEYNDKIIAMQALAPVAFMSNLRSPIIRAAGAFLNTLDTATSIFGMYEFMPNNDLLGLGANALCHDDSFLQGLCSNVLFIIAGYNPAQLNNTMIPVIAGHTPAGASTNNLVHYGQLMRSGHFRQFDHGAISNVFTYGSIRPPAYNLRNVRAPVALHYSNNDWLAAVEDVAELQRGLPNVIGMFLVPDLQFNHLDFVWAIDVEELLYRRMFNIMRLAENGELFH